MLPHRNRVGAVLALLLIAPFTSTSATAQAGPKPDVNTRYERSFTDPARDMIYNLPKKRFSKAKRAAMDVRRVRVWQSSHRDSYVRVTMRGALPRYAKARPAAWSVLVGMEPKSRRRAPMVQVFFRPRGKVRIVAWWDDNSSEICNVTSERSNRGRTYTVRLPWRCSWYSVKKIYTEAALVTDAFMDAPGAFDRRHAKAQLDWDDDLGRPPGT